MITTRHIATIQLCALLPHGWRRLWAVSLTLTQHQWDNDLATSDIGGILRHDINNVCWSCHPWLTWKFRSVLSSSWFTGGVSYGYTNAGRRWQACSRHGSLKLITLSVHESDCSLRGQWKWLLVLAWVAMVSGHNGNDDGSRWHGIKT